MCIPVLMKDSAYEERKEKKFLRQRMINLHGRQWVEDVEREYKQRKRRRRNRIKARRLVIKADCLDCRLEYLPQLDTGETFGVSTTKMYQPFDRYICKECRWYMRGGTH